MSGVTLILIFAFIAYKINKLMNKHANRQAELQKVEDEHEAMDLIERTSHRANELNKRKEVLRKQEEKNL